MIAADRGLCGAYNSNVFRDGGAAAPEARRPGKKVHLFLSGGRNAGYQDRIKDPRLSVDFVYPDIVEKIDYRGVKTMMAAP